MFRYKATVVRVIDGDTIIAMIDLGFKTWKSVNVRFYGINTPESRTRDLEEKKRGLAAKARLVEILDANDNKLEIQSHGIGKYGRCLGELFVETLGETPIHTQLINEGHGVEYFGGKR